MKHTMQDQALTIGTLFRRAERPFGDKRIHSAERGEIIVTTYAAWAERTRRLASGLIGLGLSPGARVATFAWNSVRHLEISFAAPLAGYVFHALNVRLPDAQLSYVVNDAEDELIFVDRTLLDRLLPLLDTFTTVRHIVVMDDVADTSADTRPGPAAFDYEDLLSGASEIELPVLEETLPASVSYTSGTTGNPKGVVYSHRSLWLHTMSMMQVDTIGLCESDTVLPLVPFFHANAWDLGYAATAAGADLVLPGADMSGPAVARLIEECGVTFSTGVPAIWTRVLPELRGRDTSRIRMLCSGGSAVPARLTNLCLELTGVPITQVWGMTETAAFSSIARSRPRLDDRDPVVQAAVSSSQGVPVAGIEFRITAEGTTEELPWDGMTVGELQCRGPWVISQYHGIDPAQATTPDGWFRTGDAACIDPDGYLRLKDRFKDLIKSGGEWIPSAELETSLIEHPDVIGVAVVAVPSDRWDERPIAVVVRTANSRVGAPGLREWLRPRVPKLWLPDEFHFVSELPATSVGKIDKKALRERFAQRTRP